MRSPRSPLAGSSAPAGGLAIAHLFIELRRANRTGTAIFEKDDAVRKVYVKDGEVVFASSNAAEDRLGLNLLRAGRITRDQYEASLVVMKETGRMQGAVLVEMGALRPQDLVAGVQLQVKEIIRSLLAWRDCRFRFDEGPLPLREIIPLRLSTGNVILEGLRGLEWRTIRTSLPPLRTVLRPVTEPTLLFQGVDLTADQRAVLTLIDGRRSIEEICRLSGMGDYNTLSAVYFLLAIRLCEPGDLKSEAEVAAAEEAVREAVASGSDSSEAGTSPEEVRHAIRQAFEELPGMNHYQVLGVGEQATPAEIKKAYFTLAKRYHPDRHYDPDMADLKPQLESLFSRLTEAYTVIGNQQRREEYDLERLRIARNLQEETAPGQNRTASAENQFANGLREYKAGNFWGASEAFSWAVRLSPDNARYHYYHGMALGQMPRRHHDAEVSLRRAIELEPSNIQYYLGLGALYVRNNLKARAAALYREALRWDPDSEKVKQALAEAGADESPKQSGGALKGLFTKKQTPGS